jgi:glycosyltransferase involved in cell wall biosynthesis
MSGDCDKVVKKFVMYVPAGKLSDIHRRAAWYMLPLTFWRLGLSSTLICGSAKGLEGEGLDIRETGFLVNNPWEPTDGLVASLVDSFYAFREIIKLHADFVIVGPTRSSLVTFLPLVVAYRLSKRLTGNSRARFILKADTDLDLGRFGGLTSRVAKVVIALSTWVLDGVTAESSCAVAAIKSLPLSKRMNVHYVPIGVGHMTENCPRDIPRKPVILCVGRISRTKDQATLIRAFSIISERFQDWSLRIVGPTEDEDYFKELVNLVKSVSLSGRIVFCGHKTMPELESEYLSASIFCLPTRRESAGNVRYEASLYRVPVVTTEVPCRKDIISHGWVVVKIGDPIDVASKLEMLIKDPGERNRMAGEALSRLKTYEDVAEMYLDLLSGVAP